MQNEEKSCGRLSHLNAKQLDRLYRKAHERMNDGYEDTYPNYGWDWPTLRIVKPGWYLALKSIVDAATQLAHKTKKLKDNAQEEAPAGAVCC
jgi:hypothetical protein